jgi:3'(2'), 5'-bisphosphate nucleotidase
LKGFDLGDIVEAFAEAAIEAGREIMALAKGRMGETSKPDGSPVTAADLRAEEVIRARLGKALPGLLVIGEEGDRQAPEEALPDALILVDPLDGTRDFLRGSPVFTVNIALIEGGRAIAGVVHAPALGRLFAGSTPGGAFEMAVGADGVAVKAARRRPLEVRKVPPAGPLSLESRSHRDEATRALIDRLAPAGRREVASSLKFALIAAGEGDLYARAVALNEWDIAAGDALLSAAGGAVLTLAGETIRYGTCALKAPPFVAIGDPALRPLLERLRKRAAIPR